MEYVIGFVLGLAVCAFARFSGFDRERVFYPTVTTVVATYYVLFATMANSTRALVLETLLACVFFALAVAGFHKSLWLIVVALTGHGLSDFVHHLFIENPGVPVWWPGFCGSIDVFFGGYLALLLWRRPGFASPRGA
ncbi:MAG TPA: hypothetical protein DEH78_26210 [Solibacterales bacterium]|nr:hypothetical protein [Bryobacterales bacterium]